MTANTNIQWASDTWNPWQGCHKVSPGCKHCYMYSDKKRYGQNPQMVIRSTVRTFNAPLHRLKGPYVFTCSWSDFFIEEADAWRSEAWDIIRRTPHLTYQILTKRPERITHCLPPDWGDGYPNVWLGVSVENQETANQRVPILLGIPAALHWVSCEPMLDDVDFTWLQVNEGINDGELKLINYVQTVDALNGTYITSMGMAYDTPNKLKWIIVGGESGVGARPFCLSWVRNIIHDCTDAKVPVFVKQLGAKPYETTDDEHAEDAWPVDHYLNLKDRKGGEMSEWPDDLKIREYPAT